MPGGHLGGEIVLADRNVRVAMRLCMCWRGAAIAHRRCGDRGLCNPLHIVGELAIETRLSGGRRRGRARGNVRKGSVRRMARECEELRRGRSCGSGADDRLQFPCATTGLRWCEGRRVERTPAVLSWLVKELG